MNGTGRRVSGRLRPAFEEPEPRKPPAERPGSGVFGRMPPPPPEPPPREPRRQGVLPSVRRRWRLSGVFVPALVAAAGGGSGYLLFAVYGNAPMGFVCAAVGLVGAGFCRVLLRERIEVA